MKATVKVIDWFLKWFVIIVMGANVINVLWQVFTRFVMGSPSSWTEELARYLLIWVGLLGAAYAHRLKMHLAIDVFTERFTGNTKYYSGLFIETCVFFFALIVMFIGGMNLMNLTFELQQTSAALQIKMGYVYSVVPLSGILIMLYSSLFFYDNLRGLQGREPMFDAPGLTSSETIE